ncbi:anaerobic ribonucleoside-triphosphate reductase [Candidatus Uabimicrobium sp. HlEnr_7]|uniref:anaerobic ribonucleoside-triphosphate reductase n=1 Tax=Candidatus Uabimicrobium helgolandensis TaxID=3095367 RepID=UPI003557587A
MTNINSEELKDIIYTVSSHFSEDTNFPQHFVDTVCKKFEQTGRDWEATVLEVFEEMGRREMIPFYRIYVKEKESTYSSLKQEKIELLVGPTSNDEYIPWETQKIAQALEREGGIPKHIAQKVAFSVEQKVIRSDNRYISTALIRDLVNSELFLSGHGYYVKKQTVLGIPKYNLNSLLYTRNGDSNIRSVRQLENKIASNTFRQYALEEVFSKEVAQAHLSGTIHIEDLEWPVKYFSINSDIPSQFQIKKNSDIENIVELLANIQRVSQFISHSLNIYSIDTEEMNWNKSMLKSFISGISQNSSLSYNIILHHLESTFTDNLCKCYKDFSNDDKYKLPRFWVPVNPDSFKNEKLLKKICNIALTTNNINYYFKPENLYDENSAPITGCAMNAFVINILRAALSAKEKENLWEELKQTFGLTVKAHLDKKRFLFNLADGPLRQLTKYNNVCQVDINNSICFLSIAGLPEAVHFLCDGNDMSDGEGWELAIEILERLNEMAVNLEQRYDIRIKLVDYSNSKATEHFEKVHKSILSKLPINKYTFGPHFCSSTEMNYREKILKEGQLHQYIKSYINIQNIKDSKSLLSLLEFTYQETDANILRII